MPTDTYNFWRNEEPMCALDPLLFIPRIEYVEPIHAYVQSQNSPWSLVILDMKNFHVINDMYDYNTGDRVLADFILLLRKRLPNGSITLRFRHGDEFLFFLPMKRPEASGLFSDFNSFCNQYSFLEQPNGNNFTVSFRFATLDLAQDNMDFESLLKIAESKLREVKGAGSLRKG